ncbi:hypothetical protein EGR_11183 [Echinococcus granulosus]|uniref:Uncharacterized protein n=1 Tax=Echinococcus granulosus TaxID=6210 RepID=W6TYX2_ECHGR|nr:hypothetical protein EGR_11183 [Echinococcus granulosus]EUB53960.1 hypothetical protein EGR_11183 [Echinococcus granulosus]
MRSEDEGYVFRSATLTVDVSQNLCMQPSPEAGQSDDLICGMILIFPTKLGLPVGFRRGKAQTFTCMTTLPRYFYRARHAVKVANKRF